MLEHFDEIILNSLFFLLGDDGDAALIPRPYYSAFDSDMSCMGFDC